MPASEPCSASRSSKPASGRQSCRDTANGGSHRLAVSHLTSLHLSCVVHQLNTECYGWTLGILAEHQQNTEHLGWTPAEHWASSLNTVCLGWTQGVFAKQWTFGLGWKHRVRGLTAGCTAEHLVSWLNRVTTWTIVLGWQNPGWLRHVGELVPRWLKMTFCDGGWGSRSDNTGDYTSQIGEDWVTNMVTSAPTLHEVERTREQSTRSGYNQLVSTI